MRNREIQPLKIPIAATLFDQWRKVRGTVCGQRRRPFAIRWEKLRDTAGSQNAEQESFAIQDLNDMESAGWLALKKNRRGQIERITIPLEAEPRWCAAFGFTPPVPNPDTARFRSHPWEPELAFCANSPPQIPFDELAALNAFLKNDGRDRPVVPIKERSLEIFGDEKRLDTLAGSTVLFAKDRLSLEILRCRIVPEPLAWLRGAQAGGPVLVLENAAAFDTFRRWDKEICPAFSAIIYGHGNTVRFRDGVLFLREIFAEIGGGRPVFYFGDLDPAGLRIPRTASDTAIKNNLPRIRPLLWAYRELCKKTPRPNNKNTGKQRAADSENADSENGMEMDETSSNEADLAWLEDNILIQFARDVFTSNRRIPQEALGWEHLKNIHADSV
jgi:hypothetical protein